MCENLLGYLYYAYLQGGGGLCTSLFWCVGSTMNYRSGMLKSSFPTYFSFLSLALFHKNFGLFPPVHCRVSVALLSSKSRHQLPHTQQLTPSNTLLVLLTLHFSPPPFWYPNNFLGTRALPIISLFTMAASCYAGTQRWYMGLHIDAYYFISKKN